MKLNQNAKELLATMALVGAVIVALNAVIATENGRDMIPWSLGLLAVAILCWIWMRRDAMAEKSAGAVKAAQDAADEAEALAKRREVRRDVQPVASVEPDDLTKIKGIAAGYQRVLNDAGIRTYEALAATSADETARHVQRGQSRGAGRAGDATAASGIRSQGRLGRLARISRIHLSPN